MNRIYRLVFSKSLGALVAVSEITKGKGKGGGKSSVVGAAVSAALVAAGMAASGDVLADPCSTNISGTVIGPCSIQPGANIIGPSGFINGSGTGLLLGGASVTGSVQNSGVIYGVSGETRSVGIYLAGGTLNGSITNSGTLSTIYGGTHGIYLNTNSTLTGGITNAGTINGNTGSGIYLVAGTRYWVAFKTTGPQASLVAGTLAFK